MKEQFALMFCSACLRLHLSKEKISGWSSPQQRSTPTNLASIFMTAQYSESLAECTKLKFFTVKLQKVTILTLL